MQPLPRQVALRRPPGGCMTMDELSSRTLEFIRCHRLLGPGEGVLVGLSGGPDSVALVLILAELAECGALPLEIELGHLNHCLRGEESDADEAFCQRFAQEHALRIETRRGEVAGLARHGQSFEEAARQVRYRFLTGLARAHGLRSIALAHHADDVAETVLMRIMRGCGIRGLGALPPARQARRGQGGLRVVRPLLELRKGELLDFLARRGQTFREDSSNLDTAFLRNRVRHEIIPALERNYPELSVESLCALNAAAVKINAIMDAALDAQWGALCEEADDGAVALNAQAYAALPPDLRKLAVRRAIGILAPGDRPPGLSRRHYEQVAELAERPVGTELSLPGHFTARREHGLIYLSAGRRVGAIGLLNLPLPGSVAVEAAGLSITSEIITCPARGQASLVGRAGAHQVFLSLGTIGLPLAVRSRKPGDRFHPLGAAGGRKLKEFFIDRKVPRHKRDHTPLVVTADGRIAWVVGHAIGDPFKLTGAEDRILHLTTR